MKCREIEEKMSAYMDEMLSPEERKLVDEHVESCAGCSKLLKEIIATVEHTRGLDEIDPPSWLSQGVMLKVKEENEAKGGVFRKLFYPLHIKVPLEVVATIAIVVTAVYVFRTIQPEIRPLVREQAEVSAPAEGGIKKELRQDAGTLGKTETDLFREKAVQAPPEPKKKPFTGAQSVIKSAEEAMPDQKSQKMMQSATPAPAEPGKRSSRYSDALSGADLLEEAMPARDLIMMKEYERPVHHYTVSVKDRDMAIERIGKIVNMLNGTLITHDSFQERDTIIVELPSVALSELYGKLEDIGDVKEKEKAGFESDERVERVTLEVVGFPE